MPLRGAKKFYDRTGRCLLLSPIIQLCVQSMLYGFRLYG